MVCVSIVILEGDVLNLVSLWTRCHPCVSVFPVVYGSEKPSSSLSFTEER